MGAMASGRHRDDFDIHRVRVSGAKFVNLAFVNDIGGCTPGWGPGTPASSDTKVAAIVSTVRANGGDVSVSFGGYRQLHLTLTVPMTAVGFSGSDTDEINQAEAHGVTFDLVNIMAFDYGLTNVGTMPDSGSSVRR